MDMDGIITTTESVKYESKTHAVDSKAPVSFSIRIREVERLLVRHDSHLRENLLKQRRKGSRAIGFEIPPCYLAGEEICRGYVANALSKTIIDSWIQQLIIPQICKDAIQEEGKRSGFLVEAQVEAVKETYCNKCIDFNDYDSEGRKIPTEPECSICLNEFDQWSGIITKLRCCNHSFHRDCIFTWLRRKPSCPTCRDDVRNPRPKKYTPQTYLGRPDPQKSLKA